MRADEAGATGDESSPGATGFRRALGHPTAALMSALMHANGSRRLQIRRDIPLTLGRSYLTLTVDREAAGASTRR
jgi:hypothetical protein